MQRQEFHYSFIEALCGDLKIIFITDERTTATGHTDIHMHSFWELFYLQEGCLVVNTETLQYELRENQALIIPPNTYHSSKSTLGVSKKSVFFTFEKIKSSTDDKLFTEIQSAFCKGGFYKLDDCRYLGILLGMILENHSLDIFGKTWRMKANVTELIFHLYDSIKNHDQLVLDTPIRQNTYWAYKYAIDRLLDLYYMNDISLEQLSEKLYISPQNITKIISSAYGKSFNELKLELKMRNAKRLLRETSLSINEIGTLVGYTTSRGFLSAFLKYEGCTPSEYRRNVNKGEIG